MEANEELPFLVALKEHFQFATEADGKTLWRELSKYSLAHVTQAMGELMRASKNGRPEIDRLITIAYRIDAESRGECTTPIERTEKYLESQRGWKRDHDRATIEEQRFLDSLAAEDRAELEDSTSEYLRRKYGELGRRVASKGVNHRLFRITMIEIHRARTEAATCN